MKEPEDDTYSTKPIPLITPLTKQGQIQYGELSFGAGEGRFQREGMLGPFTKPLVSGAL